MSNRAKKQQSKARQDKRRAEKRKKRERLKQRVGAAVDPLVRYCHRVESSVPRRWSGELDVDVAIWEPAVRNSLPEETRSQVEAVVAALGLLELGRDAEALEKVAEIPRRSPLSEWRLLIRGLVSWYADDRLSALECWGRLDPERRPSRIAAVLANVDLGSTDPGGPAATSKTVAIGPAAGETAAVGPTAPGIADDSRAGTASGTDQAPVALDEAQRRAVGLVQRIRCQRVAWRTLQGMLAREQQRLRELAVHGVDDVLITPELIKELGTFRRYFLRSEPALVHEVERAAMRLAFDQPYTDLFDQATATLPGPPHDPQHLLLKMHFYQYSQDRLEALAETFFRNASNGAAGNVAAVGDLGKALASEVALWLAERDVEPLRGREDSASEEAEILRKRRLLMADEAVNQDPSNPRAHQMRTQWLQEIAEVSASLGFGEDEFYAAELLQAMQEWYQALPDTEAPRLWLADHFLEQGQLDEARPHVAWLSKTRQENPHVRAIPWKFQLFETFALSRLKKTLEQAPQALEKARELWPSGMLPEWPDYLQAALCLRLGDLAAFQSLRQQLAEGRGVSVDSLGELVRILAAAQRVHVTGAQLKPLRALVEAACQASRITALSWEELAGAGDFFFRLRQLGISYPAQRFHGGKIGKEMFKRLVGYPKSLEPFSGLPSMGNALCWLVQQPAWLGVQGINPIWQREVQVQSKWLAAALFARTKNHYALSLRLRTESWTERLERFVESEPQVFDRHWYREILKRATEQDRQMALWRPPVERREAKSSWQELSDLLDGVPSDFGSTEAAKYSPRLLWDEDDDQDDDDQ